MSDQAKEENKKSGVPDSIVTGCFGLIQESIRGIFVVIAALIGAGFLISHLMSEPDRPPPGGEGSGVEEPAEPEEEGRDPGPRYVHPIIVMPKDSDSLDLVIPRDPPIESISIGDKLWSAKNLDIPVDSDYWCYNNNANNCTIYGDLYSYQAAMKACNMFGSGWRLPSVEDWVSLALFCEAGYYDANKGLDVGKDPQNAFNQLKEGGRSGFNALLGGQRLMNEDYQLLGENGIYWTVDTDKQGQAYVFVFSESEGFAKYTQNKNQGFSCRCVKNDDKPSTNQIQ